MRIRRVAGWGLALFVVILASATVVVRSGLLRRQYVTIGYVNQKLALGNLISLRQDDVVKFLDSQKITYYRDPGGIKVPEAKDRCDQLTAVFPNSSRGLLFVGDIIVRFQFDRNCRLLRYDTREYFTHL